VHRELQSLTEDLEAAWSQGRLDDVFSAANNTSSFVKHKLALVQAIADCTVSLQFSDCSPLFNFDSWLWLTRFSGLFMELGYVMDIAVDSYSHRIATGSEIGLLVFVRRCVIYGFFVLIDSPNRGTN
jgi:hypothetical protein